MLDYRSVDILEYSGFIDQHRQQIGNTSPHMGVSKTNGTPKSSILIGFSIINHPFWPLFLETPIFALCFFPAGFAANKFSPLQVGSNVFSVNMTKTNKQTNKQTNIQSINQSINQSVSQSINQSINQSIKQTINQTNKQLVKQTINQTNNQTNKHAFSVWMLTMNDNDIPSNKNIPSNKQTLGRGE